MEMHIKSSAPHKGWSITENTKNKVMSAEFQGTATASYRNVQLTFYPHLHESKTFASSFHFYFVSGVLEECNSIEKEFG